MTKLDSKEVFIFTSLGFRKSFTNDSVILIYKRIKKDYKRIFVNKRKRFTKDNNSMTDGNKYITI